MNHDAVEKNVGLMIVLIIVALLFGTLVELVPLIFGKETNTPIAGLKPLPALELEGRDIYIREGCNTCHSQMIRPLRAETERYGHYSVAGEFVYDHPFLWGSKRTGPDLARVGKRYSDDWHRAHLYNPRDVVPESNMPAFPWLFDASHVRPVDDYPGRLFNLLEHLAPDGVNAPTVAVWSPGVYNSAYYEHSFLAQQMGVELVEGRDLVIRDGFVCMRTTRARRAWLISQGIRSRLSAISATSAVSMAVSLPTTPMAIPTSAAARAGASFTPSPTIATPWCS